MNVLPLLAQITIAPEDEVYRLTVGGWVIMVLSVGFVTILTSWSIYKVLTTPGSEAHVHSQADIQTPDIENDR